MTEQFQATLRQLNNLVSKDLELLVTTSNRTTRGDISTAAQLEGYQSQYTDRYETTQTTVQVVNDDGEVYAEAIIHTLDNDPSVALLDWVEIVDHEHRGNGIGRTLHEEAVNYIENELGAETIYTKVENPKMQSVNIDTGFKQIDAPSLDAWYKRTQN